MTPAWTTAPRAQVLMNERPMPQPSPSPEPMPPPGPMPQPPGPEPRPAPCPDRTSSAMLNTAVCATCEQTVQLDDVRDRCCPVCSTPLLAQPQLGSSHVSASSANFADGPNGAESQLIDDLTDWIQRHHRQGGDFSLGAISAAGETSRNALRSGYSLNEAFEAGRSAYFSALLLGRESEIEARGGEIDMKEPSQTGRV